MSLQQFKTYLETEEAKKDIVEKAREAGYEVSEEDLAKVAGGAARTNGQDFVTGSNLLNLEQGSGEDLGGNDGILSVKL